MKTLGELIEAVKNNEQPVYEELRYAVLALESLLSFDSQAFIGLAEAEREQRKPLLTGSAVFQWEEHFNRNKRALGTVPKEWIGWENDPGNPEYQKRRQIALKLWEKFSS